MPIKIPSHLHQNRHGIFGFRVVVPLDLRVFLPRKEIRVSLRTNNKNIAKRYALPLTTMTNNHFDRIRSATSVEEAYALGQEFVRSMVEGKSFDEATGMLRELLPVAHGEAHEMLARLPVPPSPVAAVCASVARVTLSTWPIRVASSQSPCFLDERSILPARLRR